MRDNEYTGIGSRFKGGSTISWTRYELKKLEKDAIVVVQTGVNNLLNTDQTMDNIRYQFREMIRENRDKKLYITSIIPIKNQEDRLWERVEDMNKEIEKLAYEEKVPFMNIGRNLTEKRGEFADIDDEDVCIHLNENGNQIVIQEIDNKLREDGIRFMIKKH